MLLSHLFLPRENYTTISLTPIFRAGTPVEQCAHTVSNEIFTPVGRNLHGLHLYRYIMSIFDKRQAILERGLGNIGYNSVTKEGIKLAEKCVQKCSVFTG